MHGCCHAGASIFGFRALPHSIRLLPRSRHENTEEALAAQTLDAEKAQ
jgi:hypothetical protein